ncbi:hypothetical protein F2Q69_00063369 [Brassica cretica]|uniref:PGG domain-containing protein n=1 Tax=Brassica cretica TaxID=69181 RepID=A0A8S9RN25_BRACR|nr:hypothetical protein F2Q69_00063369 [Brassica cretica]
MKRLRSNIPEEARGAFLVVFTLIITATYQTGLQPPGGDHSSKNPKKQAFLGSVYVLVHFNRNLAGSFLCTSSGRKLTRSCNVSHDDLCPLPALSSLSHVASFSWAEASDGECLMSCPECIQDVTVNGHNALHLALTNGDLELSKSSPVT